MFAGFQPVPGTVVPFAYDWPMVALSFLISVCGAYVGLRWSRRIRLPDGRLDFDRLLCASVALGGGAVWSMHFIGMVAYQTPTHRDFGLIMTLASLVVVMMLVGAGPALASRPRGSRTDNVVKGGVLTGLGAARIRPRHRGSGAALSPQPAPAPGRSAHCMIAAVAVSLRFR